MSHPVITLKGWWLQRNVSFLSLFLLDLTFEKLQIYLSCENYDDKDFPLRNECEVDTDISFERKKSSVYLGAANVKRQREKSTKPLTNGWTMSSQLHTVALRSVVL